MTQGEGHIGLREGVILVFAVMAAKLFLQYPEYLINASGPAAWQAALIMTVTALLLFLPIVYLTRRFPGRSLAAISEEVAGPVAGPLLTLAVAAWLFATMTVSIRNFTETFIVAILPTTPPSVLTLALLLCISYAAYRGLEALARTTLILIPVIAAGGFLVLLFSLPRGDVSRLFPFWGDGLGPTVLGGAYFAGMAAEAIILLVVGYGFKQAKSLYHSGLLGITLFGITAAMTVTVLVMVYGAPDASQLPFPMYDLTRLVYLGRFLQRTESLIVMFWFFAAAVRLSTLLYASTVAVAGALQLPSYRPILLSVTLLSGVLSLVPKDFVTILHLDRDWMRPLGIAVLTIPLLLLVVARLRGKGGEPHVA